MPIIIRLSCIVYRRLMIFYPREFRARFGTDLVEVFEDLACEVMRQPSLAGLVSLWSTTLWDVVCVAVPMRMRDTTVIAGALSFIASSALFLAFFRAVS